VRTRAELQVVLKSGSSPYDNMEDGAEMPCTYKWFCDVPQAAGPTKRCSNKDGTWLEFLPPVGNPSCNCIAVGETVGQSDQRLQSGISESRARKLKRVSLR
jgi:hypothetical protein